jgi:hypothetical protein
MSNVFKHVKDAISHLDPAEVRAQAEHPVRVGLFAETETAYQQMENYFKPVELSAERRLEAAQILQRASASVMERGAPRFDIEVYSQEISPSRQGFSFDPANPERTVKQIVRRYPELGIALSRRLYPFRGPVAEYVIKMISKENALFSLATALPDIVPFLTLPWAAGEFASDTAVLTANQFRMAFLLAAASDRDIGYREQKGEIASILLGAFGWRALARELVGKIPFGGGLIPKAAVAYAGTRVAGLSLERYYRIGYHYTRDERRIVYEDSLERGKTIAGSLLDSLRRRQAIPKAS